MANNEFLPLCDVLFNLISLAWYFCNIVFDVVMLYALYNHGWYTWFAAGLCFVVFSLVVNQIVSLRCYLKALRYKTAMSDVDKKEQPSVYKRYVIIGIHVCQCGVLWRYVKLFVPVDLRYVKHEVRDLCVLRLLHAFSESAPMLLIQLYLLLKEPERTELRDLILVSTVISLFSVCWALASFSKNVRLQNVHRLVFTWLGVIFQLLWRLGTVGSRVFVLTLYATLYGEWLFLVLGCHWVSMFLWLISPKNVFHGERISKRKKLCLSTLIAFVYIFAYVNLQQVNHRPKMLIFYVVMFMENTLLLAVYLTGVWPNVNLLVPLLVILSFFVGLSLMGLYYRVFHVRRLTYFSNHYCTCRGPCECAGGSNSSTTRLAKQESPEIRTKQLNDINKLLHCASQTLSSGSYHGKIPGVFNCRFSSPYANAAKRKKKKPTSFIPPPCVAMPPNSVKTENAPSNGNAAAPPAANGTTPVADSVNSTPSTLAEQIQQLQSNVPFWKRPLPNQGASSENDGSSVGSRVNIQHKLQEKKEKQLAELRVIEEEIKQGKLQRPGSVIQAANLPGEPHTSLQAVPRAKRHTESILWGPPLPLPPSLRGFSYQLLPPPTRWQKRADTPEILLAPHFLDNNGWGKINPPTYRLSDDCSSGQESSCSRGVYKPPIHRIPSDIDSQMSLPRSFTLPREFKYYKTRKPMRPEKFVRSNNSSDGDVDSGDEGGESTPQNSPLPRPRMRTFHHRQVKHETKL